MVKGYGSPFLMATRASTAHHRQGQGDAVGDTGLESRVDRLSTLVVQVGNHDLVVAIGDEV